MSQHDPAAEALLARAEPFLCDLRIRAMSQSLSAAYEAEHKVNIHKAIMDTEEAIAHLKVLASGINFEINLGPSRLPSNNT